MINGFKVHFKNPFPEAAEQMKALWVSYEPLKGSIPDENPYRSSRGLWAGS